MGMLQTSEQALLADTAHAFLSDNATIEHLRALRDREDPAGYDQGIWREFSDLGFTSILVAEEFGGLGLGHVDVGIVLEAMGRHLTHSPYLSAAVGAAVALSHAQADLQREWLPKIVNGEAVAAIALEEFARHRPYRVNTRLEPAADGFVLRGTKHFVLHGHMADFLIVTASGPDAGELTVLLVEGSAEGLNVETARLADSGFAARVEFSGVRVSEGCVIGGAGQGRAVLDAMLAALRTGASAELTGVGGQAMDLTIAYLKERSQFGSPIGSFQALQHRAAHLYAELEAARAAVLKAQMLLDARDAGAERASTVAKGMAGLASTLAVQEGVQMHGGVGMTDEFDIGLFMKRQRVLAELYGDTDYHADRLAQLSGY